MHKTELIDKLVKWGLDIDELKRYRKEELVDEYVARKVEVMTLYLNSPYRKNSKNKRESPRLKRYWSRKDFRGRRGQKEVKDKLKLKEKRSEREKN